MTTDFPSIWINGAEVRHVDVLDRGFGYGDGLFETIRLHQGKAIWLQQHLDRLAVGAERLKLNIDLSLLVEEIKSFLQAKPDDVSGVLKVTVTRGAGGRGYAPPSNSECCRVIGLFPQPHYPDEPEESGIALFPCRTRLAHQPLLAGLKHLNRLEQVLARSELVDAGAPNPTGESTEWREGLCQDYDGNIICGTMSNIFLRIQDVWHTPALDRCGIVGVFRRFVLENAASWGQTVNVGTCDEAMLRNASEVFVCNSVFGVWPVTECCGQQWSVGDATRQIQNRFVEVLND